MLTLSISGPSEPEGGDRPLSQLLAGVEIKPSPSKILLSYHGFSDLPTALHYCQQACRPMHGIMHYKPIEEFIQICAMKKKYFSVAVIFLRI